MVINISTVTVSIPPMLPRDAMSCQICQNVASNSVSIEQIIIKEKQERDLWLCLSLFRKLFYASDAVIVNKNRTNNGDSCLFVPSRLHCTFRELHSRNIANKIRCASSSTEPNARVQLLLLKFIIMQRRMIMFIATDRNLKFLLLFEWQRFGLVCRT